MPIQELNYQKALDESLEHFMNPNSYDSFSRTKEHMRINGCMDPRDEEEEDCLKVIKQTPGGAIGTGLDKALALTHLSGQVVTIGQGMVVDSLERTALVQDAHHDCAFWENILPIVHEMADPSDFTEHHIKRLHQIYQLGHLGTRNFIRVKEAAARQEEVLHSKRNSEEVLAQVDMLHPEHPNVRKMKGKSRAGIYIHSHHPYSGLDRQAVHRTKKLEVQAYHDNIKATIDSIGATPGLKPLEYALRASSVLLRSVASMKVIMDNYPDLVYLEVNASYGGLKVTQQEAN